MIYSLTGSIMEKTPVEAVLQCGGVGYLVNIPLTTAGQLPAIGAEATLYTYMNVSENDVALFGFGSREEREIFTLLIGVSGVGPKVGLAILSAMPPDRIVLAVGSGDHKAFTAANGVGPKLAQRLVLELRDKVAKGFSANGLSMADVSSVSSPEAGGTSQAIAALVSLGYSQSEAAAAVAKVDPAIPVSEMIRLALQGIGAGR